MTATQKFYALFFIVLAAIVAASFAAGYRAGYHARDRQAGAAHVSPSSRALSP